MLCLGIDTSNYTTSAALFDNADGSIISKKRLLPVSKEACGLRQSDAVFHHIKAIGEILQELFCEAEGKQADCVAASAFPRRAEGSYMPVFLVGLNTARSIAASQGIPCFTASHQEGHIVAALYSAKAQKLLNSDFYAFHVSGGTTEALLVKPNNTLFNSELILKTNDLNAGQLIDRVGVMLSMQFPCGNELDKLAAGCSERITARATLKEGNCCLSGIQNKCEALFKANKAPEYIARLAIEEVSAAVCGMTDYLFKKQGKKPVLYAGGVMCNSIIRKNICEKYDEVYFASPEFSSDNAAGTAIIGSILSAGEH